MPALLDLDSRFLSGLDPIARFGLAIAAAGCLALAYMMVNRISDPGAIDRRASGK